jgi:hypothetical protein
MEEALVLEVARLAEQHAPDAPEAHIPLRPPVRWVIAAT